MHRRETIREIGRFIRPVRGKFIVSSFLLLIVAGASAAKAFIIQPVVDAFESGTAVVGDLTFLCLVVIGIFGLQAFASYGYMVISRMASARVVHHVRRDLFSKLAGQSLGYFAERPSADLLSRVMYDVAAFEHAAIGAVQVFIRDIATVAFLLVVMFTMDVRIALICLGVGAVSTFVLRAMSRRVEAVGKEVQETTSAINQQATEMIGGIDLVIGFGLRDRWETRFRSTNDQLLEAQVRSTKLENAGAFWVQMITALAITAIVAVTGHAVLTGTLTPGGFGALLGALYLIQAPALTLSRSIAQISRGMAAARRAFELFQHEVTVVDPDEPKSIGSRSLTVELDSVCYEYRPGTATLTDVSFTAQPGELIAMVGDSGAGKSTVAKLIMRFYDPKSGEVRVGGVPIREQRRDAVYRHISYVAQDVYVFDGTVEYNLRIGKPDATPEELNRAIRIACLDEYLAELPDGLDTVVGERGSAISGGQRQRIAIARAVLTDAEVLILDEATSALDMELEQRILQNLVDADASRTIFAVTHRLSLADIADRVLVLKEGRLVEEGPAEALALQDGEFSRLRRAASRKLRRVPVGARSEAES